MNVGSHKEGFVQTASALALIMSLRVRPDYLFGRKKKKI